MKIEEEYLRVKISKFSELKDCVINLTRKLEPSLSREEILADIKKRDEMGDGLVSTSILIIHVIDQKIKQDTIFYITLENKISYFSVSEKNDYQLAKVILLVINPKHNLTSANHLMNFIKNK
ncbi:PTS transporter subunit EIIA [Lactobacillus panisapium]|uniref:PTS sugar transporter subunit IIA n=1 Tax=Lactobacillus panisapium TaxID=2012495 RepID=UPI001C6952CB|nr:PTS sugar transporter subunit IIA [Lactobacillus panisapium]QYN55951.1 PTS transporter subunit EIIA [Lactobacillus panisapium]